jgi:hypothetical protein
VAVTKTFGEITIGGNAINNPPDYSWTTYENYPGLDLSKSYQRINVIVFDETLKVNLEVTGLAEVINGHLMTGPNDLCAIPCPPFC